MMRFKGWARDLTRVRSVTECQLGSSVVAFRGGVVEGATVSFTFRDNSGPEEARLHLEMNEEEARDLRDKLQRALDSIEEKRLRQAQGIT